VKSCLHYTYLSLSLIATTALMVGCGGSTAGAKKMGGAVSGSVTFQGQPVSEGSVQLYSATSGDAATATLDAAGKFKLTTPIPIGSYKVSIMPPPEPAPQVGVPYAPKEYKNIPLKYRADATSPLKAEIKAEPNVLTLEMTP
jgi:hypothetical protein